MRRLPQLSRRPMSVHSNGLYAAVINLYVSTPAAGTEPRHREEKQRHVLQYIRNKQPVRRLLFALLFSIIYLTVEQNEAF